FARTRAETAARVGRRQRWVALYEEVRRRHAAGEALEAISRAMNLAVGTVRKYAAAESFPVPEGRPLRRSILDPYLAHLQARRAWRWTPGWPTPGFRGSALSRPLRRGWSRTGLRSKPRSRRPGAAAKPRGRSPGSS